MVADFAPIPILREKLTALERQMRAQMDEIRATFEQPTDKGTSAESLCRELLRTYLPRRFELGHGEIIDARGNRSAETDLVIVNEDHPVTFTPDLPGFFLVEGVSAAGEVKSILTASDLKDALKKSNRFKSLEAKGRTGFAQGNPSDMERFHDHRPWFLLAFESQLTLQAIHDNIDHFMTEASLSLLQVADAVFVLDRGWVVNFGDGKGELQFGYPNVVMAEGWAWRESDLVLADLLAWLSVVMPRALSFEPILTKYMFSPDDS